MLFNTEYIQLSITKSHCIFELGNHTFKRISHCSPYCFFNHQENSAFQNTFRKVWVSGGIRCNYNRRIRRSKNNMSTMEEKTAKLKGEKELAEKVKELKNFQAQKEQEVTEKFSRASRSNLLTKAADISQRNWMNSQPLCSAGRVEGRLPGHGNLSRGGVRLEEIPLTLGQPKCNKPVMLPRAPGRQPV